MNNLSLSAKSEGELADLIDLLAAKDRLLSLLDAREDFEPALINEAFETLVAEVRAIEIANTILGHDVLGILSHCSIFLGGLEGREFLTKIYEETASGDDRFDRQALTLLRLFADIVSLVPSYQLTQANDESPKLLELEAVTVKTIETELQNLVVLFERVAPEVKVDVISIADTLRPADIILQLNLPELKRLFWNMLKNSVKHGAATELQVTFCLWTLASGPGAELEIKVADNGNGIPDTMLTRTEGRQRLALPGESGGGSTGLGFFEADTRAAAQGGMKTRPGVFIASNNGLPNGEGQKGASFELRMPVNTRNFKSVMALVGGVAANMNQTLAA